MTYEESLKFLNKYIHVLTQTIAHNIGEIKIKYLIIAPKDYEGKEKLVSLIFRTGRSNELVLTEQGVINTNLDVYWVASPVNSDDIFIGNLSDYLSASDQH